MSCLVVGKMVRVQREEGDACCLLWCTIFAGEYPIMLDTKVQCVLYDARQQLCLYRSTSTPESPEFSCASAVATLAIESASIQFEILEEHLSIHTPSMLLQAYEHAECGAAGSFIVSLRRRIERFGDASSCDRNDYIHFATMINRAYILPCSTCRESLVEIEKELELHYLEEHKVEERYGERDAELYDYERAALEETKVVPLLRVNSFDIPRVFRHKVRLCCFLPSCGRDREMLRACDAEGSASTLELLLCKQGILSDIIQLLESERAAEVLIDKAAAQDVMEMLSANILTSVAPKNLNTPLSSCWLQHLYLIYEIVLRILQSEYISYDMKKEIFAESFSCNIIQLFRSRDGREREYIKSITHCLYSQVVSYRAAMRQSMSNAFLECTYDKALKHRAWLGMVELLEVYGSIASGFVSPIKDEHRKMLLSTLIPLHAAQGYESFNQQLSFVLGQFVQKESSLIVPIVSGILRYWPVRSAVKQLCFLGELEELLALMKPCHFSLIKRPLIKILCMCVSNRHFQVSECAMGLLNTQYLFAMVLDNKQSNSEIIPELQAALEVAADSWNVSVKQISTNIQTYIKMLSEH